MKRILVTGAAGQLGMSLREIADECPEYTFDFATKEKLDITQASALDDYFQHKHIDVCINAAAYTDVEGAERSPETAYEINATGVKHLALTCKKYQVLLIHISTDYVFDGNKEDGYTPEDKPRPINAYGASKLQGETYVREILDNYVILRTSWLYSDYGKNFFTTIRRKLQEEGQIGVTDLQRGCPTHARDLARYILDWLKDPDREYGILHFSGEEAMTWYDFARNIAVEHAPDRVEHVVRDNRQRGTAARPANSVLLRM